MNEIKLLNDQTSETTTNVLLVSMKQIQLLSNDQ